jgi:hypothetical protein
LFFPDVFFWLLIEKFYHIFASGTLEMTLRRPFARPGYGAMDSHV